MSSSSHQKLSASSGSGRSLLDSSADEHMVLVDSSSSRPPTGTTARSSSNTKKKHDEEMDDPLRSYSSNFSSSSLAAVTNSSNSAPTVGDLSAVVQQFDPYSPPPNPTRGGGSSAVKDLQSLLDQDDVDDEESIVFCTSTHGTVPRRHTGTTPGTAGFLEMEIPDEDVDGVEEVLLLDSSSSQQQQQINHRNNSNIVEGPIQTDSGLLLTHRKVISTSPPSGGLPRSSSSRIRSRHQSSSLHPPPERLELEHEWYMNQSSSPTGDRPRSSVNFHSGSYYQQYARSMISNKPILQRWLSYARGWVILSTLVLLTGTMVVLHHLRHEHSNSSTTSNSNMASQDGSEALAQHGSSSSSSRVVSWPEGGDDVNVGIPDHIVLLPLPQGSIPHDNRGNPHHPQRHHNSMSEVQHQRHHQRHRHLLSETDHSLHQLFVQWMEQHQKQYESHHEHVQRFQIWKSNHERIQQKNQQHGPCQLTQQPVFGLNHFSDLSHEEFQQQYLTGYGLSPPSPNDPTLPVLDPAMATEEHRTRVSHHHRQMMQRGGEWFNNNGSSSPSKQTSWQSCDWYDVSCYLRYFFETYLYGLGRTMEPMYDADSYPMAVDWRQVGAVTDVHAQGNCGACWAITAVETIESAYFLSTGELLDLSEAEVIVCADDCEMCSGGWPQSAFEYVMDHKGIPLESDLPYSGDTLLQLTQAKEGGDEDGTLKSYAQSICPSNKGGGGGGGGHSGDKDEKDNSDGGGGSSFARYGNIQGYGYATEKCVCYTDGTGCDCDSQNEGLAVRNIASYGPSVVCVDASTWQDYKGGIMTSESGCSRKFLDVNHCVQVVGYAFSTADGEQQGENEDNHGGGGSHDNNNKEGSRDDSDRVGYWIVRNQWSSYWGMNGYAYVAMGENTCGILNDMIQVYS